MTLGFAAAAWTDNDERNVMVAADTRLSRGGVIATDAAVKTYELGGPCAMVASGNVEPPMMAAELTRSLVDNSNRRSPEKRVTFIDTVRILSFFLRRGAKDQGAKCLVAVAGFLGHARPCLARVIVSPDHNRVGLYELSKGETIAIPVGDAAASRLLLESMAQARREKRHVIASAVGALWYIANLEVAFTSVGGGISVGACAHEEGFFSWPLVELENRLFLRGTEVTNVHRPDWPKPVRFAYDESWCAVQDQRVASIDPAPDVPKLGTMQGFDIDEVTPETLFMGHEDPADLRPIRASLA